MVLYLQKEGIWLSRETGMEQNIQSIKYSAKYPAIAEIYYYRNQPKYVF